MEEISGPGKPQQGGEQPEARTITENNNDEVASAPFSCSISPVADKKPEPLAQHNHKKKHAYNMKRPLPLRAVEACGSDRDENDNDRLFGLVLHPSPPSQRPSKETGKPTTNNTTTSSSFGSLISRERTELTEASTPTKSLQSSSTIAVLDMSSLTNTPTTEEERENKRNNTNRTNNTPEFQHTRRRGDLSPPKRSPPPLLSLPEEPPHPSPPPQSKRAALLHDDHLLSRLHHYQEQSAVDTTIFETSFVAPTVSPDSGSLLLLEDDDEDQVEKGMMMNQIRGALFPEEREPKEEKGNANKTMEGSANGPASFFEFGAHQTKEAPLEPSPIKPDGSMLQWDIESFQKNGTDPPLNLLSATGDESMLQWSPPNQIHEEERISHPSLKRARWDTALAEAEASQEDFFACNTLALDKRKSRNKRRRRKRSIARNTATHVPTPQTVVASSSQDNSSCATLSSLENSWSPRRTRKGWSFASWLSQSWENGCKRLWSAGHSSTLKRTKIVIDKSLKSQSFPTPVRPTKAWKITASTARFVLWVWTVSGLMTTTALLMYQGMYLHQIPNDVTSSAQHLDSTDMMPLQWSVPYHQRHHHHSNRQHSVKRVARSELSSVSSQTLVVPPVELPPPTAELLKHVAKQKSSSQQESLPRLSQRWRHQQRVSLPKESSRRVVSLDGRPLTPPEKIPHRSMKLYPAAYTDHTQLYGVLDSSDDPRMRRMERRKPLVDGECVPMNEWQTTFHPSCNEVHSMMSLERLGSAHEATHFTLFGRKGYWRNAWRVDSLSPTDSEQQHRNVTVVLKTLKIAHQFEEAHFEHDRIDAVAMERLTASQHVINIFGFCGHSVVTEYADGKSLGSLADKAKKKPLERLRIARDIAQGLADVHGIDGPNGDNVTFVHLDINPANVISVGGTLKLNDFNIGILRQWNTSANQPCGFQNAQYPNPQWRSPEEALNHNNLTEKVDVFSMGHIFFRLICGHEPWNKFEPNGKPSKAEVAAAVQQGILPTIPTSVTQSTDDEVVAVRQAMLSCFNFDPKERPSARQIASTLQTELDRLEPRALQQRTPPTLRKGL